jgi:hypothetical protein
MPSFSYEVPQDAYAPNTFTYDLQAYAYGYPPPLYSPPVYPYSYYPYYSPGRQYWRMIYREMTLGQYIRKQLHGPVRVRDIVPGIPELGVQTRWQG